MSVLQAILGMDTLAQVRNERMELSKINDIENKYIKNNHLDRNHDMCGYPLWAKRNVSGNSWWSA